MNTPHERLTRTTFSLPLGEVHALVGGAVNARPLLFLHGFPDHPPTTEPSQVRRAVTLAIPHPATFLRSLAYSKQWKKSWYMGLFQLPGADYLVRRRELALIDRLWRAWSPSFTLDSARRDELHACLERSLPAPLEYYRAIVRPLTTFIDRVRKADAHIATPLLQLHGSDDGCIVPPTDEDRRLFDARVLEVVPNLGHFLHIEAPATIAARVARWLAQRYAGVRIAITVNCLVMEPIS